ncbi:MAG: FkbM family methyltransferase [Caldilineaceae bacterium]
MHYWQGLLRSILIYYGNPVKLRRMRRFYSQFIRPGALCFDIGAHVGNRLWAWSTLGAHVVGVEPQPQCMKLLRRWYGRNPRITLVEAAIGATPGVQDLWISARTPTVTTLSRPWIEQVQQAASFAAVQWEEQVTVEVITLDDLIARYGAPTFCKIDVEGYELEVLRGLSQPLPTLSFEYLPAAKAEARACLERLTHLGDYRFNWSVGEEHRWQAERWCEVDVIRNFLAQLATDDHSGDIYARLKV